MSSDEDPNQKGRRGLLVALCGVGSAAYGAALLGPAVPFLSSGRASGGGERWIRVAQLERLKEGAPERVRIVGDEHDAFTVTRDKTLGSVWLSRKGDTVSALSAECPHLGCAVALDPSGESFG